MFHNNFGTFIKKKKQIKTIEKLIKATNMDKLDSNGYSSLANLRKIQGIVVIL